MMGVGKYSGMMGANGNVWASVLWVIVLIDLILLGLWLWKQIQGK